MKGWYKCPVCTGSGEYLTRRDAHRSGGWVPCGLTPEQHAKDVEQYKRGEGHKVIKIHSPPHLKK